MSTVYLVIANGHVHLETLDQQAASTRAEELAQHGADATLAQVVGVCEASSSPAWRPA